MAEPIEIPDEPLWWRGRDRDGDLWHREPDDDGSTWRCGGGSAEWTWADLWTWWGPIVCADGERGPGSTLRKAVAALLEFATERDAALAGLLEAIADAIDEAVKLGAPDPAAGPVIARAMRLAEHVVGDEAVTHG